MTELESERTERFHPFSSAYVSIAYGLVKNFMVGVGGRSRTTNQSERFVLTADQLAQLVECRANVLDVLSPNPSRTNTHLK